MSLKGKYCIVGVSTTKFGRLPGSSPMGFTVEAAKAAIEDAGLTKKDIDAVLSKAPVSGWVSMWAHKLAEALGLQPHIAATLDSGGATAISLVQYAMMAIDSGLVSTAVIAYGDYPASGPKGTYNQPTGMEASNAAYGSFGTVSGYAAIARRHMLEYGTTSEQLAAVAVSTRRWATMNPNAQMRKPMTLEDHQNSRMIAAPLRLFDCCLVSDGGAAFVVTSAERARNLKKAPVYVMGIGQHHVSWEIQNRPTLTTTGAKISGEMAFSMAGVTPADVDVLELYDCFTPVPIITLEDYGFCSKGEGGPLVEDCKIGPGGSLPMNTSGGLLSESGIGGWHLVVEAVCQLRGEGGLRQVQNAEIALVSGQGGIMHDHATLVLRR